MATRRPSAPATTTVAGEWECDECGYMRRGTLRNRPQQCPECGAPSDAFSFWSDDEDADDLDAEWDELDEDEEEEWDDEDDF